MSLRKPLIGIVSLALAGSLPFASAPSFAAGHAMRPAHTTPASNQSSGSARMCHAGKPTPRCRAGHARRRTRSNRSQAAHRHQRRAVRTRTRVATPGRLATAPLPSIGLPSTVVSTSKGTRPESSSALEDHEASSEAGGGDGTAGKIVGIPTSGGEAPVIEESAPSAGDSESEQATSEESQAEESTGEDFTGRLFSATSVWNAPLAADDPIDPSSAARLAPFDEMIAADERSKTGLFVNTTAYTTPFYVVGPKQPRVHVQLAPGHVYPPLQKALDEGVPIPEGAKPAVGTDAEMTIYQPSTDSLWDFWRAAKTTSGWEATWGGAMQHVTESAGYFSDESWPGLTPMEGWTWGANGASLPAIAGVIRIPELRAGHIEHALAMALPEVCAEYFSFPAQRTDGTEHGTCIPEGAHLRLNPSLDLSALHLSSIARMLAEAAQRFGIIVQGATDHNVAFYAEDPTGPAGDPYVGAHGLFAGLQPWVFLAEFPWRELEILHMHICTTWPCVEE